MLLLLAPHRGGCLPLPGGLPRSEQIETSPETVGALGMAVWEEYPFTVNSTTIPNLCSYSDEPISTGYLIGKLNNHL